MIHSCRKPQGRKLAVDGVDYYVHVGSNSAYFRNSEGKRIAIAYNADILGLTQDDYERACRKNRGDDIIAVTPAKICAWIRIHLIGGTK